MALRSSIPGAGVGVLVAMLLGSGASAQCEIASNPDFVANDGDCVQNPDPNGGCNVTPPAFQQTGTLTRKNPTFTINGTMGYDSVSGSRDLDWFTFEMPEGGYLNVTVRALRPDGSVATPVVFLGDPSTCEAVGYQFGACPGVFPETGVQAGTHMVVVTVPFAATEPCGTAYSVTVSARFSQYLSCGDPDGGNCGVATSGIPGCVDPVCCDRVCTLDFLCCEVQWDEFCAETARLPVASGGCGVFVYECAPPSNAPSNDCATAATAIALGETVAFNNSLATTDGPNNGQCAADTAKDVWFKVQADADGTMLFRATSPGQDMVLSVYDLGGSSAVDGPSLDDDFVRCVDVLGIGAEDAVLEGVVAGNWYLWRLGIWGNPGTADPGVAGAGTVEVSIERVVWDTGAAQVVCNSTGGQTYLGLSSGAVSTTLPQRWALAPFTVTDPDGAGPQSSWRIGLVQAQGFTPAGSINERMNWIIWSRSGTAAPNYATGVFASGQLPFPVQGDNYWHDIPLDVELPPGDYYLTLFASAVGNPCRANDGQTVLSNFAWLVGAPNATVFSNAQGPFVWRSQVQPGSGPADEVLIAGGGACEGNASAAGFLQATVAGFSNCTAGGPASVLYALSFRMLGDPVEVPNDCPPDFDGNGEVNALDLATLLAAWGTAACDLDGNGATDALDLAALLAAWGPC